jgi:hypothetical protein
MISNGRILLLDVLDATGSDLGDARDRAALLRAAGARVTALAIGHHLEPDARGLGRDAQVCEPGAPALRAARLLATSAHFDHAIVASAEPGGGAVGRTLPPTLPASWWPTGLQQSGGWLGRLARTLGGRELPSLFGAQAEGSPATLAALNGCFVDPLAARRATLPLWDGEIVLAPEGFAEPHGPLVWSAFAALADEWSELDLVTWSHPRPADEVLARRLGAASRIHQVGPPPRMAEWAWWSQARAVLLTGSGPLSGGLALRALSTGCPILFIGEEEGFSGLARELQERGCSWRVTRDARVVAAELARLLLRGPEVQAAIERGRILAAHHDRAALERRLAAALGPPASRDAAAA